MPVDFQELQRAGQPLEERILDLLRPHAGKQALSIFEIIAALEGYGIERAADARLAVMLEKLANQGSTLGRYEAALDKLVRENKVQTAMLRGEPFYGIAA